MVGQSGIVSEPVLPDSDAVSTRIALFFIRGLETGTRTLLSTADDFDESFVRKASPEQTDEKSARPVFRLDFVLLAVIV